MYDSKITRPLMKEFFFYVEKVILHGICLLQYNEGTWNFQATQIRMLR